MAIFNSYVSLPEGRLLNLSMDWVLKAKNGYSPIGKSSSRSYFRDFIEHLGYLDGLTAHDST